MFRGLDPRAQNYVPPRMSEQQLHAIEERIRRSRDATSFGKRVIIWLLHRTNGLTKAVSLSMPAHFCGGSAEEVQYAAHDMYSVHLQHAARRLDGPHWH